MPSPLSGESVDLLRELQRIDNVLQSPTHAPQFAYEILGQPRRVSIQSGDQVVDGYTDRAFFDLRDARLISIDGGERFTLTAEGRKWSETAAGPVAPAEEPATPQQRREAARSGISRLLTPTALVIEASAGLLFIVGVVFGIPRLAGQGDETMSPSGTTTSAPDPTVLGQSACTIEVQPGPEVYGFSGCADRVVVVGRMANRPPSYGPSAFELPPGVSLRLRPWEDEYSDVEATITGPAGPICFAESSQVQNAVSEIRARKRVADPTDTSDPVWLFTDVVRSIVISSEAAGTIRLYGDCGDDLMGPGLDGPVVEIAVD